MSVPPPIPFPVHKAVFVGAPPKLTLSCAPTKIVNVVTFMLRQKTAVEDWAAVTCRACLAARGQA